jgi:PAS domain-containing protein
VIDNRPRSLTPDQKEALRVLGKQVMMRLELRRRLADLNVAHAQEQARLEKMVQARTAELVQTNSELQASRERFRVLSEAAFEGVSLHREGAIVDSNEQLGRILGRSRQELIAHSPSLVLILHNLISNALKFMPQGTSPRIRIWAELREQPKDLTETQCEDETRQPDKRNPTGVPIASSQPRHPVARLWDACSKRSLGRLKHYQQSQYSQPGKEPTLMHVRSAYGCSTLFE